MAKQERERVAIVACEWLDAMYNREPFDNLAPLPVVTFGFIWKDTPEYYTIAFEMQGDGTPLHFISIPKGQMWPKIKHIGYFRLPLSFYKYMEKELAAE